MKKVFILLGIICICTVSSVYAVDTLNVGEVETRITSIQQDVPSSVPAVGPGYDRKGYVGSIIANIFTATQKIKSDFILAFRDIIGSNQNNIPKWNGNIFRPGTIYDVGGNIGVGTSSISTGLKLDVEGKVGATEYCDENGANCFVATSFPAQWYQANNQECSNFCTSRGLSNIGDPANSNALCTSGENRFSSISNIIYSYGTWGGYQTSSTTSVGGMCYRGGQPRDNDGTDITTGCFCSGGTQVGSNQVSGGVGGGASIWSQVGSTTYLLSNNVGIGTSSPSTALHVGAVGRFDGGVQVDGRRAISNTNRSHTAQSNLSDYGFFQMKNAAGDTGAYIGAGNGGNRINFVLHAADRMNISGGNVGIGVNDPGARLHVNGNIISHNPTANNHVATKAYVDSNIGSVGGDNLGNHTATNTLRMDNNDLLLEGGNLSTGGGTISVEGGNIGMGGGAIYGLASPTSIHQAVTKKYVDDSVAGVTGLATPPLCNGANKTLGWNGTTWICNTSSGVITGTCNARQGYPCNVNMCNQGVIRCDGTCSTGAPDNDSCRRCFTVGTMVTMADGTKKDIVSIEVGEQVRGSNNTINTVLDIDESQLAGRLLYSFNGGRSFVTAEHPFRTRDGWKSIDIEELRLDKESLIAKLNPKNLYIGDEIILEDGSSMVIETISSKSAPNQTVYNLKLDGDGIYFADGFMTHHKY